MNDAEVVGRLILTIGVGLTLVVVVIAAAVSLGFLFLRKRIEGLARQALDKELEEHKHRLQMQADAIRVDQQRQLRDFDLFTEKRHKAYAGIYRRLLVAEGAGSRLWGIAYTQTYEDYSRENVETLLKERRLPGLTVSEILTLWDADRDAGRKRLAEALREWEKADARHKLQRARNYQLLNTLYFSPAVRGVVEEAYLKLAALVISVAYSEPDERVTGIPAKKREAQAALDVMRDVMQAELARGDYVVPSVTARAPALSTDSTPTATVDRG